MLDRKIGETKGASRSDALGIPGNIVENREQH
jgi:hypothetical protein